MACELLVISNNPRVWESPGACLPVAGRAVDVLYKALELATRGYALYSHPIAGNARLLHNPFRTIIMQKGELLERDAQAIDRVLQKLEAISGDVPPETREDYQLMDYELYMAMQPGD